jgi:hypothetical protein
MPLTNQPWIDIPTELRAVVAFLLPAVLCFHELRDPYADWKIRRMSRKIDAELREAGLLKKEHEDEPHLILRTADTDTCECSECGGLFVRSADLADEFIEHVRIRHRSRYKFPIGVRVRSANSGRKNRFPFAQNDQE